MLHTNTLKRYIERDEKRAGVLIAEADELEEEVEFPVSVLVEGLKVFNIGNHLSQEQRAELLGVLESFDDVFIDLSDRTDLVECQIKLEDSSPCRKAQYKVQNARQPKVER